MTVMTEKTEWWIIVDFIYYLATFGIFGVVFWVRFPSQAFDCSV